MNAFTSYVYYIITLAIYKSNFRHFYVIKLIKIKQLPIYEANPLSD